MSTGLAAVPAVVKPAVPGHGVYCAHLMENGACAARLTACPASCSSQTAVRARKPSWSVGGKAQELEGTGKMYPSPSPESLSAGQGPTQGTGAS